jgi:hypothetical protein
VTARALKNCQVRSNMLKSILLVLTDFVQCLGTVWCCELALLNSEV